MNRQDLKRWERLLDLSEDSVEHRFADAFLEYWQMVVGREHGDTPLLAVDFPFEFHAKIWEFSDFNYTVSGHFFELLQVVESNAPPSAELLEAQKAHEEALLSARDAAFTLSVAGAREVLEPTFSVFAFGREVLGLEPNPELELGPVSEGEVELPEVICFTNKRVFRRWVASARKSGFQRAYMSFDWHNRLMVVQPECRLPDPLRCTLEEVDLPELNELDAWWSWLREAFDVRLFVDERQGVLIACQHHIWEARRPMFMPLSFVRELDDDEELPLHDKSDTPIEVEATMVGFATRRLRRSLV